MKFLANQYMVGIQEILLAVTNNNTIIVVVCGGYQLRIYRQAVFEIPG